MRIRTYRIILFIFFLLLAGGLFYLQIVKGGRYHDLSRRNSIRLIPQEPYRGRIFDRNNNILVDNTLSFDAVLIPEELKDRESVFEKLSRFLGVSMEELFRRYDRGYLNPFTPVLMAASIPKTTAIVLGEQNLDLPGVSVELNSKRFYPFSMTASHALGHVGEIDKSRITKLKEYGYDIKDKVGYSGLEERLDIYLRGEKGGQQVEVDNRGRQVRLLGYKPPLAGKDAQATLDLELQQVADNLLHGKKGAIVLMDVAEGEVLVLSSAPGFDPNIFVDRKDKRALNYFLTSKDAPLFNRAISGQFPPGSVFKVATALAALKAKRFPPSMTFVCRGQMKIGNRYFKCWDVHGPQDFYQAFAHSCDVYFYHLGFWGAADGMTNMAHELGLGSATGIDLSNESPGFIPSRLWKSLSRFETWYDGDTANFSIGQGYVLVTPIQMTRMMAAVANGGYLPVPRLTKAIDGAEVAGKEPKKLKAAKQDLDLVKAAMRLPVSLGSGTAHALDVPGLEICAKTGTAQVHGGESHGWVAGFFPLSSPKYAFCILLENVGTSHYAVELARELLEEGTRRNKF